MHKALRLQLQSRVTKAATFSGTPFISKRLARYKTMTAVLQVFSAERDSGNETYSIYITTGDANTAWDVLQFPPIASTGAKEYVARVDLDPNPPLMRVNSTDPGVAANDPATFQTDTAAAAQGIRTLPTGQVRHGPLGDRLSHELVVAGTVVTGIDYRITVMLQ